MLRLLVREVEAHFLHHLHDLRMDARAGLRACRDGCRLGWIGEPVEPRRGHLRPARVMNAGEQYRLHGASCPSGNGGANQRSASVAAPAPRSCATTNPGASTGRIPAKVSLAARASVTAGFANEVDDVNQYAA